MLASCGEKPPIATVENEWHSASNQFMPANIYATMQVTVNARYTYHNAFAVSVMRGVNLLSFTGPGASARYSCMPPTPSIGSTATARTMMPMPPSHCSCWR